MALCAPLKKLAPENFPKQYQDIISQIAYPFNTAIESVISTVNGQIDFDNTPWQYKQLTFTINADGTLPVSASFPLTTTGQPKGMQVIQVVNNTNVNTPLTAAPFISYSINASNMAVLTGITGLTAGNNYTINVIVYA